MITIGTRCLGFLICLFVCLFVCLIALRLYQPTNKFFLFVCLFVCVCVGWLIVVSSDMLLLIVSRFYEVIGFPREFSTTRTTKWDLTNCGLKLKHHLVKSSECILNIWFSRSREIASSSGSKAELMSARIPWNRKTRSTTLFYVSILFRVITMPFFHSMTSLSTVVS